MVDDKKNIIGETHADYKDLEHDWQLFKKSYIGGSKYIGVDTLFAHQREDKVDYERRVSRGVYFNYCEPVVETYVNHIFGLTQGLTE